MKNTVELSDVLSLVRENGHLGYIKIIKPKNMPDVKELGIATTLFKKSYIERQGGDEILNFGKKQLNITEIENILKRHVGNEVRMFIGNTSFNGILK